MKILIKLLLCCIAMFSFAVQPVFALSEMDSYQVSTVYDYACKSECTDHVKSLSGQCTPTVSTIEFLATPTQQQTTVRVDSGRGLYTVKFQEPYFADDEIVSSLSTKFAELIQVIDSFASPSDEPLPFECVSDNPRISAGCFAVCSLAQNVGCACSSVEGGCSCECFGAS